MPYKRERQLAASIRTLIKEIGKQLVNYPDGTEQNFLQDFVNTLLVFNLQDDPYKNQIYQEKFSQALNEFISSHKYSSVYYQYPFLWFAIDFIERVRNFLFFEKEYFKFMVKYLRRVYQHFSKKLSLSDEELWEKIQNEFSNELPPLLNNTYKNPKEIITLISEELHKNGLSALKVDNINSSIKNYFNKLRKFQHPSYVKHNSFFTAIEGRWTLKFAPEPFKLIWVFIKVSFADNITLNKFLELFNSKTNLLSTSLLYKDYHAPDIYGRVLLPSHKINQYSDYLHKLKSNLKIISIHIDKVNNYQESVSYNFFRDEEGWNFENLHKTDLNSKEKSNNKLLYLTAPWNTDFQINSEELPLYTKILSEFWSDVTYEFLHKYYTDSSFSEIKDLLKGNKTRFNNLYHRKVMSLIFKPNLLIESFSRITYVIEFPLNFHSTELTNLLSILPNAHIYTLEKNSKLFVVAPLNQNILDYLNKLHAQLGINHIVTIYQPNKLNYAEFDEKKKIWKLNLIDQSRNES